jgi:hypothetical protein
VVGRSVLYLDYGRVEWPMAIGNLNDSTRGIISGACSIGLIAKIEKKQGACLW